MNADDRQMLASNIFGIIDDRLRRHFDHRVVADAITDMAKATNDIITLLKEEGVL